MIKISRANTKSRHEVSDGLGNLLWRFHDLSSWCRIIRFSRHTQQEVVAILWRKTLQSCLYLSFRFFSLHLAKPRFLSWGFIKITQFFPVSSQFNDDISINLKTFRMQRLVTLSLNVSLSLPKNLKALTWHESIVRALPLSSSYLLNWCQALRRVWRVWMILTNSGSVDDWKY